MRLVFNLTQHSSVEREYFNHKVIWRSTVSVGKLGNDHICLSLLLSFLERDEVYFFTLAQSLQFTRFYLAHSRLNTLKPCAFYLLIADFYDYIFIFLIQERRGRS